jgi:hypothetical protein
VRNSAVSVLVFFTLVACANRGITGPNEEVMLTVVGSVTDCADASPLPNARISVDENRWGEKDLTLARTTTDEDGHYGVSFSDRKLCDAALSGAGSVQFTIVASRTGYHTGARGGLSTDGVRCIEGTQRFDFCLRQLQ